jgi:hypothetical protein
MTDRDDLIDRTTDAIEGAFARAAATPEGCVAYGNLRASGATLTINGREVNPETGETRRERRNAPDPETRGARLEGHIGPGDPDDVWPPVTYYGGIDLGKRTIAMPFGEDRDLAELGAALCELDRLLSPIVTWELRVAYLWGEDLGKVGGEPRLWRLKEADAMTIWALGRTERVVDLFVSSTRASCPTRS